MSPLSLCLHTGMRVRVSCLQRAAAEIHQDEVRKPSLCVCGCMQQDATADY